MNVWRSFSSMGIELTSHWWGDISMSKHHRQDAVFFTLSAAYSLLSLVALIQLIRMHLRVPEYGWTIQKVFHFMNFIFSGVRAIIFWFYMFLFALECKVAFLDRISLSDCGICVGIWVLTLVLLDLPGLLFFSSYMLLVLFWAEIYYQARSLSTDELRTVYVSVNCVIYVIQVCIWIILWIDYSNAVQAIGQVFIAAVSLTAAVGFLLYGGRLFFMLRHFPIESKGRSKKLREVGSVTVICFMCFLIRCFMVMVSAFDSDASLVVPDQPILDLVYYVLVEILPSALVLFILRKLPKRLSEPRRPVRKV